MNRGERKGNASNRRTREPAFRKSTQDGKPQSPPRHRGMRRMARRAISSKSPRPCRQRSIVCWPTRWCAGSLPRNRTPSCPRYCGRPWCSISAPRTDGRGDCPLSRQPPVTGRAVSARRIGDELGVWRRRMRAEHQLTRVAYRGSIGKWRLRRNAANRRVRLEAVIQ